jgi:membrane fusion protein (multidrug efflux system)
MDSFYLARRLLAYCLLGVGLSGCGNDQAQGPAKAGAAATAPPPLAVSVLAVQPRSVPIVVEAVGQAEGSREVEVRARVSGILEKRLYNEGEPVRAGQTLFVIDRASYEIAVAQARAALAEVQVRQELAQREATRLRSLVDKRAISQREYDEAVSSVKQSQAAIEGARAKLAEAQLNLSYTEVRAPIAGITSRAVHSEGSLVAANTDLLTTITQVQPIWVRFSLAESDFERIRDAAKQAQVQLMSKDGTVAAAGGKLNFAASTVDPKLGTVQLRAEFPNPERRWLPGQFVPVRVQAATQQAFLVPQSAVVQTEQARMVWVVTPEGTAAMKPVQTAQWIGNEWVVTGGLQPGEQIIVDNLIKLRPGVKVEPRASAADNSAPPVAAGTETPAGTRPPAPAKR